MASSKRCHQGSQRHRRPGEGVSNDLAKQAGQTGRLSEGMLKPPCSAPCGGLSQEEGSSPASRCHERRESTFAVPVNPTQLRKSFCRINERVLRQEKIERFAHTSIAYYQYVIQSTSEVYQYFRISILSFHLPVRSSGPPHQGGSSPEQEFAGDFATGARSVRGCGRLKGLELLRTRRITLDSASTELWPGVI